ncbi:MAG: efflux RND transporter periplasmic adaptor subunit [bacterium]
MKPPGYLHVVLCIGLAVLFLYVPAELAGGMIRAGVEPAFAQHEGHGGAPQAQPAQEQPEEQDGGEEVPTVEIPLEKQQLIGIKTVEVGMRSLQKTIRTIGRIDYDEKRLATITTKFEGWIEKLYVDYTGREVRKGEPLAEFYSPELFATQQEFLNVLKWKEKAQEGSVRDRETSRMLSHDADAIIEAARQRLRLMDISDEQIREIETTGKVVKTLTLVSPVDGTVIQKAAVLGMRVMPGEKLFDIADLSRVWIMADIYEYDLSLVREGDSAAIRLSYYPGKEFTARIEYVSPELSAETRTVKVRFSFPNPGGRLKPQMFTNVELRIGMGKRLAIPEDAVIDTGERQIVYIDKGDGYFEPREVTLGLRADGMVEVLKGLRPKEKVASAANFLIDSEARLKGIVK